MLPRMARKRAVVTGGAGFLGSHLCGRLLDEGLEVLCLDNFLTGNAANVEPLRERGPFRLIRADVTDYVHVAGPVDYVCHFASPASPIDYLQLPIETLKVGSVGTLHTLGLAREKGARYFLASTSETYGDPQIHPQPETYWGHVNPVGPRGVYDEAKRFAEAMTMAYRRTHGVDTTIIRIFNSVLADEQVLYDDGETLRRERVGDLAARIGDTVALDGFTVPAFDGNGTVSAAEATWLVGHPTDARCYRVRTRYGRTISVTGDHSLFVRGADGRPEARPVDDLAPGDHVAIAARLDVPERDRTQVSMLDVLAAQGVDPWLVSVRAPGLGRTLAARVLDLEVAWRRHVPSDLPTARQGQVAMVRRWIRSGTAPLGVLQATGIPVPCDASVFPRSGRPANAVPLHVEITDDLLLVLGLWVAEGCVTVRRPKTSVIVLSCDEQNLDDAAKILHRTVHASGRIVPATTGRSAALRIDNDLLVRLFDHLGFTAGPKRIPGWVLGLPKHRLNWFLEGYRRGDGVHSGRHLLEAKRHEFSTVSDDLKDDLVVAFARYGLVPSVGRYETTFKQRTGDRKYPFWRLTLANVAPWDMLDWDVGVTQTLNAMRFGDLVWARVEAITEVPVTPLVYDFCVPGRENFWAGTGVMAHNTYGPNMRPNDGRAIPTFIRQALHGEPVTVAGDGSQTRSVCYVDDLVEGIVRLLFSDLAGPVNVGNPHELSVRALAERIVALAGSGSAIAYIPRPEDDPTVRQPDITLARTALGWEPKVPLDEGLARTIDWFRAHLAEIDATVGG
jgi:nucleoside-diphosphate-sugar epimerase/intein/homing endonuclease